MDKIIDLVAYKIKKSLKDEGFTVKEDRRKGVKLLIKLNNDETS